MENASLSIVDTPVGIIIVFKLVQPLNVPLLIAVTFVGMSILASFIQPLNAWLPIVVTLLLPKLVVLAVTLLPVLSR